MFKIDVQYKNKKIINKLTSLLKIQKKNLKVMDSKEKIELIIYMS